MGSTEERAEHRVEHTAEDRILDAAKRCCEHWGFAKVTIEDIAAEAQVSRATLYRLFPGGKDVLFEALRVRELAEFFEVLRVEVDGLESVEEVVVTAVVVATRALRADEHLAMMLASEPDTALGQLTVEGLPRIVRMASVSLAPFLADHLPAATARRLIDILARLTISYFLAPSDDVDLGDEQSAREFLGPVIRVLTAADHAADHEVDPAVDRATEPT